MLTFVVYVMFYVQICEYSPRFSHLGKQKNSSQPLYELYVIRDVLLASQLVVEKDIFS